MAEQVVHHHEGYSPLIWSLNSYSYCDIHHQALSETCPQCHRQQPYITSIPDQSICEYCHHSLMHHCKAKETTPDASQIWVANTLKGMLVQQRNEGFNPTAEVFHANLRKLIQTKFGNSHRKLCRHIGLGDYALKNWITQSERPSFAQYLTFCYKAGIDPVKIATELIDPDLPLPTEKAQLNSFKRRTVPRTISKKERDLIGFWLIEQLNRHAPLCVADLAKEKNVTTSYLKYWFAETCAKLIKRWNLYVNEQSKFQRAEQAKYIESVIAALFANGIYPSRRKVSEIIRKKGIALAKPHHLRVYINCMHLNFEQHF